MKLANPAGYADRKVYGDGNGKVYRCQSFTSNGQLWTEAWCGRWVQKRCLQKGNAAFNGRRNRSAAFGAGLGVVAGGIAASQNDDG